MDLIHCQEFLQESADDGGGGKEQQELISVKNFFKRQLVMVRERRSSKS